MARFAANHPSSETLTAMSSKLSGLRTTSGDTRDESRLSRNDLMHWKWQSRFQDENQHMYPAKPSQPYGVRSTDTTLWLSLSMPTQTLRCRGLPPLHQPGLHHGYDHLMSAKYENALSSINKIVSASLKPLRVHGNVGNDFDPFTQATSTDILDCSAPESKPSLLSSEL